MKVKFNAGLAADTRSQNYLVIERWGGMDNAATYTEQAQSLRRSLDSIEAVEKAFETEVVTMLHKSALVPGMVSLASVESNDDLERVIRKNFAHARMASADRQVLPLADWDASREEIAAVVNQLESAAVVERYRDQLPTPLPVDPSGDDSQLL